MKTWLLSAFSLFMVATSLSAKTGWDDDYEKSLAKAKESKKMVLLDFTGSDWCGYCMKLDAEVFSKPAFKKFAKANLILVELDFPHNTPLPKKTEAQNKELGRKYNVNGYPTIVLLDSEGKEAARFVGYDPELLSKLEAKVGKPKTDAK
ncbi:thioredoxin family protein [Prosthecobacter sp.]|uniref:thioredoxin family protein n=1 Tax=Prosthecobacter sp. TaxID=1965333 RepID=UPI00378519C5